MCAQLEVKMRGVVGREKKIRTEKTLVEQMVACIVSFLQIRVVAVVLLFPDTDRRRVSVALIGGVSRQCYHSVAYAHNNCGYCTVAMRVVSSANNVVVGTGCAPP